MRRLEPISSGPFAGDYHADAIQAALPSQDWEDFCVWMDGQTMAVDDDGRTVVFARDWQRWQRRRGARGERT